MCQWESESCRSMPLQRPDPSLLGNISYSWYMIFILRHIWDVCSWPGMFAADRLHHQDPAPFSVPFFDFWGLGNWPAQWLVSFSSRLKRVHVYRWLIPAQWWGKPPWSSPCRTTDGGETSHVQASLRASLQTFPLWPMMPWAQVYSRPFLPKSLVHDCPWLFNAKHLQLQLLQFLGLKLTWLRQAHWNPNVHCLFHLLCASYKTPHLLPEMNRVTPYDT